MTSLEGENEIEKLKSLSAKKYQEQAVWCLNAYWNEWAEDAAEDVWKFSNKFVELDEKNGKEGCEINEFSAHRFLEAFGETLTVREMREVLREIDLDTNKNVSLAEYLIYKFKIDWKELVNKAQVATSKELQEAEEKCNAAKAAMDAAVTAADTARAAEAENQAALKELEDQQAAYDNQVQTLTEKSESGGLVSRNKARNELAQLQAEDPLPLSRAKINQGAAVRKAEKARKAVEPAEAEAVDKFNEADAYLKEVAARSGSAQGGIWWLQRELEEQKKYLPQRRGGGR